jgi:quinolinate synthase
MSSRRPFPALLISSGGISAQGSFAEAQAAFLEPDPSSVDALRELLESKQTGIVAHFYMDPELQGVIAQTGHRFTHISDSLVMADRAVDMARAGARRIVVLGVDFMAENVRAVLDAAGFSSTPVYRVEAGPIGCSLAEAAEAPEYLAWLEGARKCAPALHVVYINTSLYTKAHAHSRVPTITCTSSNVVRTVLAAFAQIPNGSVWFGPDTYMGRNLRVLFETLIELSPSEISALHAGHDRESLRRVIDGFHFFERGNCVVHHLFGDQVANQVRDEYASAYIAAHLEVPGAMFRLGLDAQRAGRGVVGSTSDILNFVGRTVDVAVSHAERVKLSFVLGTETGMVTSLVRRVRAALIPDAEGRVEVEIVFPVAADAVTVTAERELPIVPGPMAGEGCSIEGGCATCPYMKKNNLTALFDVLERIGKDDDRLAGYAPRMQKGELASRSLIDWATEPINHMRAFSRDGVLPDELVTDVLSRNRRG